ncbi:MAG: N-formylglutamate amidohydrolase [Paracoccaceae bacterium]
MATADRDRLDIAVTENASGESDVLLVCEHASNHLPPAFGTLGLSAAARQAHIAWDPGALGLSRALVNRLDCALIHATVSRLVYDLNRPPHATGAMPAKSEVFDIPGNANLGPAERLARTESIYLPFHAHLHAEIARRMAIGRPPTLITIHSFTPVYFGQTRAVEFGVIHDADPTLANHIVAAAQAMTALKTALNAPYSAQDGVTHTLRLQATPYGLANVMLEIRNDLLATPEAEADMADRLAPVLQSALTAIGKPAARKVIV